jgi:hypothetical protein
MPETIPTLRQLTEGLADQEDIEVFVKFMQENRRIDPKKEIEIQKWILAMILDKS